MEVAQEQYDKQARLVARLENKLNKAEQEIRALRVDLSNEKEILAYYKSHPALRESVEMNGSGYLIGPKEPYLPINVDDLGAIK